VIQRYDQINEALDHLISILTTQRNDNKVYVPDPSTVRRLRQANALCARNMIATDFYVESGTQGMPSKKPKRGRRG
jgi:hypothetical protein